MERGALYLVAAPSANLSDITVRALEILRSVAAVACDDTRAAKRLLDHFAIVTPLFDASADPELARQLCERLDGGDSIALISDSEKPMLSPAAAALAKEATRRGLSVVPIAGPNAIIAAVKASGLGSEQILFLGVLPHAETERREVLSPIRGRPYTLVIQESPRRLADTLSALERTLGNRRAVVAREELFVRDRLSSLAGRFAHPPEGDVLIVVGSADTIADPNTDVESAARSLLAAGMRPTEVARTIGARFGLAKKEAYRAVMDANQEPVPSPDAQPLEDLLLERLRAYAESLQGLAPENMYGLIMPQMERPLIRVAMEIAGGRQVQAADMLGIHRNTLRMKLRALGLDDQPEPKEET